MSFMHMDATTAASAEGDNIQLLNQDCTSQTVTVAMGLRETGKMNCFDGTATFPWNWIDPLSDAPGDPSYQIRRINFVGNFFPAFGPFDGVWDQIGFTVTGISSIATAGSGYSVNDTLTLTGGTFRVPVSFNVDSIGGGGSVTAVSVVNEGSYSAVTLPNLSGSPTTVVPAGGTGCTLNITIDFIFNWVLFGSIALPAFARFDVQLRLGTGPVLRTASWGMTTVGGTIP